MAPRMAFPPIAIVTGIELESGSHFWLPGRHVFLEMNSIFGLVIENPHGRGWDQILFFTCS
jgi:hypothetical protein